MKQVWHTPIEVAPAEAVESGPSEVRTELEEAKPVYIGHEVDYLYDGQMPVCEQEFEDGVLQATRVNFLGARGIEAVLTIDHTRGNQARLSWLLYDGHGNLVRTMASDYTLSGFQWRGVWGEVQSSLGAGRGYCANLGHLEDETGLVYMRARYYEPLTGRFISEDPARDGVNWYLYADGNPVGLVDVHGLFTMIDLGLASLFEGLLERGDSLAAQAAQQWGKQKIIDACSYWSGRIFGEIFQMEVELPFGVDFQKGYVKLTFRNVKGYIGLDFTGHHGRPHIDFTGEFAHYIKKNFMIGLPGPIRLDLFAEGFLQGILR